MNVWVNENGKVVKVEHDPSQSTTSDELLIKSSIEAAGKARFSAVENDSIRKGRITYNFNRL